MSLTKEEIGIISRIDESVRNISEHVLPEIKTDVREARDLSKQAVHDLSQLQLRVYALEDATPIPIPTHVCEQAAVIARIDATLKANSSNKKLVIPIIATLIVLLIGFLAASIRTEASTTQRIETLEKVQQEQSKNIDAAIAEMSKSSERLEAYNKILEERSEHHGSN